MACKITVSRVCKGRIARPDHVFVIIKFKWKGRAYMAYEEVAKGMSALHGDIAARLWAQMQHKYGLYPPAEIVKKNRFERFWYRFKRFFKRAEKQEADLFI